MSLSKVARQRSLVSSLHFLPLIHRMRYDCLLSYSQIRHNPNMSSLQAVAPGGTITGTGSPFPATGYSSYTQPEEESEAVR